MTAVAEVKPISTTTLRRAAEFPRARLAYGLMLCSAVSFATMSACATALQGKVDWRIVGMSRAGLAFTLTFIVAKILGKQLVWPGPRTLWIRSLTGSVGMICTFFALAHLPVSGSVTLLNSFPLWLAILSWPVLGVRPTWAVWVAILTGFSGVVLIASEYHGGPINASHRSLAIALALIASVSTAIVMLGLHKLRRVDPFAIAVHFAGISMVVFTVYAFVTSRDQTINVIGLNDVKNVALLLGVGVAATCGQLLMTTAFQHGPPDRLSTIGLTQTIFVMLYEVAFFGHSFTLPMVAGVVLVSAPAAWLVARRRR